MTMHANVRKGATQAQAHALDRRLFLAAGAAGAAIAAAGGFHLRPAAAQATTQAPYTLPSLPYATAALEPHIDAQTMELHHGKHHQAYVTNLNNALADHGQLQRLTLAELLAELPRLPEAIRNAVRNNGGGHANHAMFWSIMAPNAGGAPEGDIATAIDDSFGGFDAFKKAFNDAGAKQFGSGWVFVTVGADGKLAIKAQPNQDTPLMQGQGVVMGNDVWEHAYYLKYQNRRADYLTAWWNLVNWHAVNDRLARVRNGERI
ncbi:superoxide dismutase [Niveispirillum fermenti]|uniref:superoxide dismutase n=1 Tax=Niveispirillum fermenti TaxID=1233113 RepID=UPI003A87D109